MMIERFNDKYGKSIDILVKNTQRYRFLIYTLELPTSRTIPTKKTFEDND